jgi:cytoskeletal protein CcmA (bactofilin family)
MANPLDPKGASDSKSYTSGVTNYNTGLSGSANPTSVPNSEASSSEPTARPADVSVVGKKISIRGELVGSEDLHIEGSVEGTIRMSGQHLSIGREGKVSANVHAQNIVIDGTLTGDVLAEELINICSTAVVKGNLIAPRIQLDDGGKFRGSMDMVDTNEELKERRNAFQDKLVHPHLPATEHKADNKPKNDKPVEKTPEKPADKAPDPAHAGKVPPGKN